MIRLTTQQAQTEAENYRKTKQLFNYKITGQDIVLIDGKKMKWCTKCFEYKSIHDFHKNKSTRSGLEGQCKYCRKESKLIAFLKELNAPA